MAKNKTVFFCQNCGYESSKWMGQCPACKEWNTMVEEPDRGKSARMRPSGSGSTTRNTPVKLSDVKESREERLGSGIAELDRVLGGGIVKGSLVLVGGDPGIGKSTLLLQMCHRLSDKGQKVLYISGEESYSQIKMRSARFEDKGDNVILYCETCLEDVEETIFKERPDIVIVDSIQTMYRSDIEAAPGSVSQVRETTGTLMRLAKQEDVTIFIIGHVTKEGTVAGPRVLEHMVDTVLYFEGDRYGSYRVLRAVKNRFGSTNEIGVFEMCRIGLKEVPNPSEYMLSGRPVGAPGSTVTCAMEGTRPIMIEIQALTSKTNYPYPKRTAAGIDYNRINIYSAVLEKRLGFQMDACDIYVNIAGGIRVTEPATDLAIIASIISSYLNKAVDDKTVILGEVGLTGEVRAVSQIEQRVQEAAKLGFTACIVPFSNLKQLKDVKGIDVKGIRSVKDLAELFK